MPQEVSKAQIRNLSFIEFVNTFSLLVVGGAVSTAYFFVQYFKADVPLSFYWVLGSGVWIIYTADHLRDGMRLKESITFLRHAIHYRYRQVLIPTVLALAVFDVFVVIAFFNKMMWSNGLILGGFVLLYFISVSFIRWRFYKEIFVAFVVCVGMVIYPGLLGNLSLSWPDATVILIFILLNLTNLTLFSYFDYSGDKQNGTHSIALFWGLEKTKSVVYQLLATTFVMLTIYAFLIPNTSKIALSIAVLVMLNILLLIVLQEEKFANKQGYRFWGDFIYLVPGFIWVFINGIN